MATRTKKHNADTTAPDCGVCGHNVPHFLSGACRRPGCQACPLPGVSAADMRPRSNVAYTEDFLRATD